MSDLFPNYNQQDATFPDLFISTDALHVSDGLSAHHQEHKTLQVAKHYILLDRQAGLQNASTCLD